MIATNSVCQIINDLKIYGYDLYLAGENIQYKFHSLVEPPKEQIAVLLDSLRRNKPEVISYLRSNERQHKPLSFHEAGLDMEDLHKMPLSEFEKAGKVMKIWSEVLKEHVYFVPSEAVLNRNPFDAVAYTAQELTAMLGMTPDEVRAAHEVKKVFGGAKILSHKPMRG